MADPTADSAVSVFFKVTIDGEDIGTFASCDGLAFEVAVEQREEGGENTYVHQFPGRVKFQNLKLTRPVGKESKKLADWFARMQGQVKRSTCEVFALSSDGKDTIVSWKFKGVIPVKWQGPQFTLESAKVATETLELAHHGFLLQGQN